MRVSLIIKRHWFNEIRAGRKKQEFRAITPRLINQICNLDKDGNFESYKPISEILLLNGYHKKRPTMLIECLGIEIAPGQNGDLFAFNLGKVLKVDNC